MDKKKMTFGNGFECYYVSSKEETEYIYNEVFVEQQYIQNGIVVNDGDCIFDVGANIGMFSLFINRIKPNLKTYAFEPIKPIFEVLQENIHLHSLEENLLIFNFGLSSKDHIETVFTFYPKMAGNSTFKPGDKLVNINQNLSASSDQEDLFIDFFKEKQQINCKLRTLSAIVNELKINRIDLLKIDVEGAEFEVFQGIETQDWSKIKQVVAEVHDKDGKLAKISTVLKDQGFKIKTEKLESLPSKYVDTYNLYAIRS